MSEEKVYVDGLFYNKPSENAPDFVLANMSIVPSKMIAWLQAQKPNAKGYVKVQVLTSKKTGNPYCALDTWESKTPDNNIPVIGNKDDDEVSIEDVPF